MIISQVALSPLDRNAAFGRVGSDILSKESWYTADYYKRPKWNLILPSGHLVNL